MPRSVPFPKLILEAFGVDRADFDSHVRTVDVEVCRLADDRKQRVVTIYHHDKIMDSSKSRAWREA